MRRPLILLALLTTALALVGASWLQADVEPPSRLVELPTESDDGPTPAGAGQVPDAPPEVALAGELEQAPGGGDGEREVAEAPVDTHTGPRVLVVRGPADAPVAAATVCFLTEEDARQRQQLRGEDRPRVEWPEAYGARHTTNPDGLTTLPPGRQAWLVAAFAEGEFAFGTVPPGNRTVTLQLVADETVTLRTLTADSAIAPDVPLALLVHQPGMQEAQLLWRGRSDAKGEAECRHFQVLRPGQRGDPAAERYAALPVMTAGMPAVTPFAGRPATREPVRVYVPAHTAVDVQLTDHHGAALLSPANVALWVERPRDYVAPFPIPGQLDRPRLDKPPGAASVHFDWIATDSPIRIGARFPNERRGAMSGPLRSPGLASDPPLAATLPLAPELGLFAGRLVTADQRPFGPQVVPGTLWDANGPLRTLTVHTLPDGRFDLPLLPVGPAGDVWFELRTEVIGDFDVEVANGTLLAGALPRREIGARVRCQNLVAGQRRELGTIVLGELPPLCTGIVVDDLGAPVADAELKLQRHEPPAKPQNPERNQPPADPWRDLPLLRTRSAADGTFVLRGEQPRGELRVRADTDRHFADSAPLRYPGQELRIVVARNGILRGRVLLPGFVPDQAVTLTLRPFDETARGRDTKSLSLGRGGRFTLEPLRPGRYDVLVTIRNVAEPLATLPDLFVTPGECRDARLRPLDLRQSLFRYRLRAVDAGGRTLAIDGPILARLKKLDGSVAEAGFRWQKGQAELITGSTLVELVAFGRGCEPTALVLGPGDHDVYLKQVAPARLFLPGARQLCGPDRRVRVSVVLTEEIGLPQWLQGQDQRSGESFTFPRWELGKSNGAWLGAFDDVEVPIVRSGKYEVILRIHATESERSAQQSVSLGVFELHTDAVTMPPVRVPVDAAKIEQTLQQLDRTRQREPDRGNNGNGERPRRR